MNRESVSLPEGEYQLQVESLGIKCYLQVTGPIGSLVENDQRILRLPEGCVSLGLRSQHSQPQATIHTSKRPRDLMRAISCFGSALKSTSPERAWPSLRGFPPIIDIRPGPFTAPEGLERRDTPISIEIPSELEYIFPIASLAYYTNAYVRPGSRPTLIAGETEHRLEHPAGFEVAVQQTLEQLFLFDCITRTEGLFPIDLYERSLLERRIDLDIPLLYEQGLAEQVNTYLSVPWETIKDIRPTWKQTADMTPKPNHGAYIPFAVSDLAHIRILKPSSASELTVEPEIDESVCDFYRADDATNSITPFREAPDERPIRVTAPPTESIEHAWLGSGVPVGASIPTAVACHRQLKPIGDGPITVQVIANAPEMAEERSVKSLYGFREYIDMEVSIHEEQSVAETRALLERDHDFLHYIGHATPAGLKCADGCLDVQVLDEFGGRAFVLNACQSYVQGQKLIDAGAVGGVVTLEPVANVPATTVGLQIGRLLNAGFSLAAALHVIGRETITGQQYVVLGSGNARIANTKSGSVVRLTIERLSEDEFSVSYHGYPTTQWQLGSTITPHLGENTTRYLNSGTVTTLTASTDELKQLLKTSERVPVTIDGTLQWSDQVN